MKSLTTLLQNRLIALFALIVALCVPAIAFGQSTTPSGSITIDLAELPTSLDPPADWAIEATWIHMNIFDCLVWHDRQSAKFVPWLAESWQNVNDTTWRFKLRQGVKFQNGEPFNASAVVWTYQRILDGGPKKFITYNQWTFIKTIKVINPYEVEIVTKQPEPAFLSKMSGTGCGIQAPIAGKKMEASGKYTPIGTGPYEFVEYAKDDHLTLKANPNYFLGAPKIKTIVWRSVPEASTRVADLLTGAADLVVAVQPQDWNRIDSNPGTHVTKFLTTQVMLLALRAGPSKQMPDFNGPTEDVRVRQAIEYAIDRKTLLSVIDGMGVPTLSRLTPPTLGWSSKTYNTYGDYDPAKAKELLKEAGYHGQKLTFYTSNTWLLQKQVAEVLTQMLQAVGLNVDLQVMDTTTFREQVYYPYHNKEIYMDALGNSFFDPWIVFLSEESDHRERSGWSGPYADQADKLIREAAVNMDPQARAKQYQQIQDLVYGRGIIVPLYQMKDAVGMSDRLDWTPPLDGFLWMGNATLK